MKKQEKFFAVLDLSQRLKEAKSVVLINHQGLTALTLSQLRNLVKKSGGQLLVVKNTLLKIAAQKSGLPEDFFSSKSLKEPTAIVLAYEDEIAPLKVVFNFSKNQGLPKIKSGFFADRLLSKEEIEQLSVLPDRQVLIGKLINVLSSPLGMIIKVLSGNQEKLILILKGLKN